MCTKTVYPLSVGVLRISVMCSIPICVARSFICAYPSLVSFVDRCIGKLGISPIAFLVTLLSCLPIVSSCLSVNIPKWMAWYLDLSNWSIASVFKLGGSLR